MASEHAIGLLMGRSTSFGEVSLCMKKERGRGAKEGEKGKEGRECLSKRMKRFWLRLENGKKPFEALGKRRTLTNHNS